MRNIFKIIGLAVLTITVSFTNIDKRTIVIDVGHGGKDTGASFENFNEKGIALEIANKVKGLNKNSDIEIVLTRDSDKFMTLEERTEFINALKPELVISIHVNYNGNDDSSGNEVFISDLNKENEKSYELALKIKGAFENENTEIKKGNFKLLQNVNHPIALFEIGFLSNESDRNYLTSEDGQVKIAKAILEAVK